MPLLLSISDEVPLPFLAFLGQAGLSVTGGVTPLKSGERSQIYNSATGIRIRSLPSDALQCSCALLDSEGSDLAQGCKTGLAPAKQCKTRVCEGRNRPPVYFTLQGGCSSAVSKAISLSIVNSKPVNTLKTLGLFTYVIAFHYPHFRLLDEGERVHKPGVTPLETCCNKPHVPQLGHTGSR